MVSRLIGLLELPRAVQGFLARAKISEVYCRHLKKISDISKQIALAKEAADQDWNVKETEKRVNEALGKVPSPSSGEGARRVGEGEADPLAGFWQETPEIAGILNRLPDLDDQKRALAEMRQHMPELAEGVRGG